MMAERRVFVSIALPEERQIGFHTLSGGVLSEVLGLVSAEDARRLGLGSGATRELLVEVDYPLHPDSVGVGAKGLFDTNQLQSICLATVLASPFAH